MAEVAEMGEVDEIHSNEEGVVLNGDITKDIDISNKDVDMESKNVDNINSISKDEINDSKDVSMDSKDVDMESQDGDTASQSAMDDDSEDTQDSQTSQDDKSQDSQDSHDDDQDQDSNMESENVNVEAPSPRTEQGDTNTNQSIPQSEDNQEENSNLSSRKNDDEDSRHSIEETNESTGPAEDPLLNGSSQDKPEENDKESPSDQDESQDGSESKFSNAENNAEERTESAASIEERAESAASIVSSTQEVHEIEDDDKSEKSKHHETIELNSEDEGDEGDVMIVDPPKTNGTEVIDLVETPEKKRPEKKSSDDEDDSEGDDDEDEKEVLTPRRSSRNVKKKSYAEMDKSPSPLPPKEESEESDIEEVMPQDPLAVNDQITVERIPSVKKPVENSPTIVVKDTKRLVEIAAKTSQPPAATPPAGKKEPTLVIIDTNSILSGKGRGPVPAKNTQPITTSNFTPVLPVAVPAQGLYPPNMRATITPIPVTTPQFAPKIAPATITPTLVPPLLPTLTDDMFVVEAPSFIVPYVYEKPPVKSLKDFVGDIKKQIEENRKKKKEKKEAQTAKKEKDENEKEKEKEKDEDKDDKEKSDKDKKKKGDESDATYSSESETDEEEKASTVDPKKPYSYFTSPLGKFFIDIGFNMVQEYVQSDLLKQQKRKREREQGANPETNKTIASLLKNIEMSKENNEHFRMQVKKCEFCNFKTESKLVMQYHLETPHMKNFVYKCNFCTYEVRSPHDILFHMEAEHAVRGHLERAPAFHQCPSCPFEDNQKGKLSRHLVVCARKFKPDRNLEPPADWEPPAKIPRMPKMRATGLNATVAAYQTLAANKQQQYQFLSKMQLQANAANAAINRGRGRPSLGPSVKSQPIIRPQGMIFKQQTGGSVLVPTNYQLSGNQVFQAAAAALQQQQQQQKKPSNTPSISITPLPRGTTSTTPSMASKPGDTNSKNSFVICEICDGYIKDLEQLRNHMQWIHKIKIHPKMIYNRPPLNCQKCQFRFFTDQGLERHLLGSHGLVTSSMQDAANKSKDSGRCPVCGRVYQWKLLNHVARDHNMTLKPAHLSYKCTVCTATFGMYKQFENHVYSAHSVVAKRVMDKKSTSSGSPSAAKTTDIKPLKINDEITIIPQPAKAATNGASKEGSPAPKGSAGTSKSR